jgi:4-hydroxythreonine-4-phosphate dehydrogenase
MAVTDPNVLKVCTPLLFGDATILESVAKPLGLPIPQKRFALSDPRWQDCETAALIDFSMLKSNDLQPGLVSATTGRASYAYITAAIDAAIAKQVDAITTAPISKDALHQAGIDYPGHTEILADRTKTDRYCMMLTSPEISCCLVTTHIGLRDVPAAISTERIVDVIQMAAQAMRRQHDHEPRIAVCGLNPHAGENGLFGNGEEEKIIQPAIERAKQMGLDITGPYPADTAFLQSRREVTDVYVCMYHDQGLIPLKTLSFDVAVNVTLGLPIVRTSVDHGTACDLAWQGKATPSSLIHAILLAAQMANH